MASLPPTKSLLKIAGIHLALILILLFLPAFNQKKEPETYLEWVDLPAAPTAEEETPPHPQPAAPPTPPKPQPVPKPTPQPKPSPKPIQKKPEPKPKPTPVKVDLTNVVKKTSNKPPAPGNANALKERLSDAVDTMKFRSSSPSSAPSSTINRYHKLIRNALYRAWKRPTSGPRPLEALVQLTILPDGTIVWKGFASSSGFPKVDQSIRNAVSSTSKLTEPLPQGMGSPNYDVTINFYLK